MSKSRRKVNDREEAQHLVAELAASGDQLSPFCRRRGIDARSLNCWQRNLSRGYASAAAIPRPMRIVELVTASAAHASAPAPSTPRPRYRMAVNDVTIEVNDDFADQTVARLLELVRSC